MPEKSIYNPSDNPERNDLEDLLNYAVISLIKEDIYDTSNGLGDLSQATKLLEDERLHLLGDINIQ